MVVVYEAPDTSFLGMIEQLLTDNGIPYTVTGAADVGLATVGTTIVVKVPDEHSILAKEIISQLTS